MRKEGINRSGGMRRTKRTGRDVGRRGRRAMWDGEDGDGCGAERTGTDEESRPRVLIVKNYTFN